MDNREADVVPDQLQRRIQGFLGDASSERAVYDAGAGVLLGTSIGKVRKKNEDRAIVVRAIYGREPERDFLLAALSDGMGGLANGEEAAIVALSTFVARMIRTARMSPERRLHMAAMAANAAVYQLYKGRGGATLSAVLIEHRLGPIGVNVGDSRVYLLRNSLPIEQMSRDDTLGEYVKDRGVFNEVDRTGSLIQYIGIGDGLEPHLLHLGQRASDHKFVLTSDGVHRDKEMLNTVSRETRAPEQLVDRLLLLADLLGGHDNATAVVIPGRMELEHSRLSEFALVLEFNSPFGEMEIWITEIGDRA
jgi:PPM family protein phosphatase